MLKSAKEKLKEMYHDEYNTVIDPISLKFKDSKIEKQFEQDLFNNIKSFEIIRELVQIGI